MRTFVRSMVSFEFEFSMSLFEFLFCFVFVLPLSYNDLHRIPTVRAWSKDLDENESVC
jgi:hypothetical protein